MEQTLKAGQVVSIRKRLWRIDSLYDNELLGTSIDSINTSQKRFYIPYEKIQVANLNIPPFDKVGELSKQELLNTAYKISLMHGTSPLLSLQRSSIIPTNFQIVPLIMALNSFRVRMLLADDVGLGKTIEAGLIINELIARQLVRKILVICPASLREQWQETMINFFKLEFKIVSSLHRKYYEKELPVGLSSWDYFQKIITSIDYAKSKANRFEILNYDWDLVIVDEAHLCARPHINSPTQSVSMQRYELIRDLSKKSKNLLLLTATPHNGYTDSFASLIEFLNIDATKGNDINYIDKNKALKHVCQRTRKDVIKWLEVEKNFNPFPKVDKKEIRIDSLSKNEREVLKHLEKYTEEISKIETATKNFNLVGFVIVHLLKRALSSPYALKMSLKNRITRIKSGLEEAEINEDDVKSHIYESYDLENYSADEAGVRIERSTFDKKVSEYEIGILEELQKEVNKINSGNDSKYRKLKDETIPELMRYSNKIIIFTRYKDTLDYLKGNLEEDFKDINIYSIYGDLKSEQRKEVFTRFEKSKKSILVATDCISEGMNLQYLCSQIIHYELPWNPNRLEQRNGRVDRFGQPKDTVHIRTLIVDGTLDEYILATIIQKAQKIKEDLGFSPPFFSDEKDIVSRLMKAGKILKKNEKNTKQLSMIDALFEVKDEEGDDTKSDEHEKEIIEKIKRDSFYGQLDIKLPDVEKRIKQTEQTLGGEKDIEGFVKSSLQMFNCLIQIDDENKELYKIVLNNSRLNIFGYGDVIEKVTFSKDYAARHPGVELIDLSHPLINRLVQVIKQQTYVDDDIYGRVAYKISDQISKPIATINVLVRYMAETDPKSIVETILTIGIGIYDKKELTSVEIEKFIETNPKQGSRTIKEIKEEMTKLFSDDSWEKIVKKQIEKNIKEIIEEREKLLATLKYKEIPKWMEGVSKVSYASHDIVSITLGYPQ